MYTICKCTPTHTWAQDFKIAAVVLTGESGPRKAVGADADQRLVQDSGFSLRSAGLLLRC